MDDSFPLTHESAKFVTERLKNTLSCISELSEEDGLTFLKKIVTSVTANENFLSDSNDTYLGNRAMCRLAVGLLYFEEKTLFEKIFCAGFIEKYCLEKILKDVEGDVSESKNLAIRTMMKDITGDIKCCKQAQENRRKRNDKQEQQKTITKQKLFFVHSSKEEPNEPSTSQAFDLAVDHYEKFLNILQFLPNARLNDDENLWKFVGDTLNELDIGKTTHEKWKEIMTKWMVEVKDKHRKGKELNELENKLLKLLKKNDRIAEARQNTKNSQDQVDNGNNLAEQQGKKRKIDEVACEPSGSSKKSFPSETSAKDTSDQERGTAPKLTGTSPGHSYNCSTGNVQHPQQINLKIYNIYDNFPPPAAPAVAAIQTEIERQVKESIKVLIEKMLIHNSANTSTVPEIASDKVEEELPKTLKSCNEILVELFSEKHLSYAWPFYNVDMKLLRSPEYRNVVENPMDLYTVKRKMEKGKYQTVEEFTSDVRLIFTNCYKYNSCDHDTLTKARKLHHVFEMKLDNLSYEPVNATVANGNSDSTNMDTRSEPCVVILDTDDEDVSTESIAPNHDSNPHSNRDKALE